MPRSPARRAWRHVGPGTASPPTSERLGSPRAARANHAGPGTSPCRPRTRPAIDDGSRTGHGPRDRQDGGEPRHVREPPDGTEGLGPEVETPCRPGDQGDDGDVPQVDADRPGTDRTDRTDRPVRPVRRKATRQPRPERREKQHLTESDQRDDERRGRQVRRFRIAAERHHRRRVGAEHPEADRGGDCCDATRDEPRARGLPQRREVVSDLVHEPPGEHEVEPPQRCPDVPPHQVHRADGGEPQPDREPRPPGPADRPGDGQRRRRVLGEEPHELGQEAPGEPHQRRQRRQGEQEDGPQGHVDKARGRQSHQSPPQVRADVGVALLEDGGRAPGAGVPLEAVAHDDDDECDGSDRVSTRSRVPRPASGTGASGAEVAIAPSRAPADAGDRRIVPRVHPTGSGGRSVRVGRASPSARLRTRGSPAHRSRASRRPGAARVG